MKKKFLAAIAALGLAASALVIAPLSAGAAAYTGMTAATNGTTPVNQTTTSFKKYLLVKGDSDLPDATFNFTITKYDATKDAGAELVAGDTSTGKLAVLNGFGAPAFTASSVSFSSTDATVPDTDTTADNIWSDTETGNEKYAVKTLELNFGSVTFTEPGVYRYLIQETGNNASVGNDIKVTGADNCFRTLDVYVYDYAEYYNSLTDKTGFTVPSGNELFIAGYALYEGKVTAAPGSDGANAATKSNGFVNVYPVQSLVFGKVVKGNQGSKDKYFKFTVTLSNIGNAGTAVTANTGNADAAVPAAASLNAATKSDYAGKTNPTELTLDTTKTLDNDGYKVELADGKYTITAEYYLQHGQYITLQGLPTGASYAITEVAEDYTSAATITAADSVINYDGTPGYDALTDSTSGTIAEGVNINTGYTNTRQGLIPTGILSTVAGSAGIVALGVLGVAGGLLYVKKKKSEDEEE